MLRKIAEIFKTEVLGICRTQHLALGVKLVRVGEKHLVS